MNKSFKFVKNIILYDAWLRVGWIISLGVTVFRQSEEST